MYSQYVLISWNIFLKTWLSRVCQIIHKFTAPKDDSSLLLWESVNATKICPDLFACVDWVWSWLTLKWSRWSWRPMLTLWKLLLQVRNVKHCTPSPKFPMSRGCFPEDKWSKSQRIACPVSQRMSQIPEDKWSDSQRKEIVPRG